MSWRSPQSGRASCKNKQNVQQSNAIVSIQPV